MLYYGQKREPRENYFPVHNRIFDLGLCAEELAIYLYLVRCEDKKTIPVIRATQRLVHVLVERQTRFKNMSRSLRKRD